ncbi:hypothetical protein [Chromobacterium subtsugae]|uniref:hypothetical protein n=1 Tax=Chromobacterium subtsugae TaxID=251747 RepID=UPI0007F884A0|nr:hypothetical protein [Chromobacterium subtsugae]OBU87536.1 hypothetical protein MY55_05190 [Chromobacterium subtsugae]
MQAASPKALATHQRGGWRRISHDADAMKKALSICLADPGAQCWRYAVDDKTVWQGMVNKRISRIPLLAHP